MKIQTLIIDDEPIALRKLQGYVEKVPFLDLVAACNSPVEAMALMQTRDIDVIFTDINMPDLDGLDFISSLENPPMVVFTTAYSEYALESYRLSAIDYLLKPFGFADFQRAANKVARQYQLMHPSADNEPVDDSIFIKADSRYQRVHLDDILYIKGYGEYLQVYIAGTAKPLVTLSSFADMMRHMPDYFLQVHRSYVVNMHHALRVERMRIIIDNDTFIPVSDSYKHSFMEYMRMRSIGPVHK